LSPGPLNIPYAVRCILIITSIFSLLWPHAVSGLSIYDVITLSQNKYKAEDIVDIILATGSAFTLTATDVIYLKKASINDSVVQTMLVVVHPKSQETETISIQSMDWLNVTLEDLLILADNEVSDEVIFSFLKTRKRIFTLGAGEIAKLRKAGLRDVAIQYLLSETNATGDPVNYYELPTISMGPYPETVILGRHPSVIQFDDYPRYYYGPSIYVGFSNIHHTLFDHQNVGLHHEGKEHHVGLHHRTEHHIGSHDIGKGHHVGKHHRTPEHNRNYHSVNNNDTQLTGINISHSVNNDRNYGVVGQSAHKITETTKPGIIQNNRKSEDYIFNRHMLRRNENKLGSSSAQTINRNNTHTVRKTPTVSGTARNSTKVNRIYRGRSTTGTSSHNKSPGSNRNAKPGRANVRARAKPD